MKVTVIHPGTQHAFRLATELHQRSLLQELHTGFAVGQGGMLAGIFDSIPNHLRPKISNRRVEGLPNDRIHLQPLLEGATVLSLSWVRDDQRLLFRRNRLFQKRIPDSVLQNSDVVIGFETSSWLLAQRCRDLGTPFVLIQTIGHPDSKHRVHHELLARFPEWSDAEAPRLPEIRAVEQVEHETASRIVVSSSFTRSTLMEHGVDGGRITVVPHGVDCRRFHVTRTSGYRPFRFIYAGLIDARKGIPLLLEAWKRLSLPNAELWLVGPASRAAQSLVPDLPGLRLLAAMPQVELPALFNQSDVFVFPSYFEGFGLVILQAMACGLPVITTTATAGLDVLTQGVTGWVHPPGDLDALCRDMETAYRNSDACLEMGLRARVRAEELSWTTYGNHWARILPDIAAGRRRNPVARSAQTRVLVAHPGTQYSRHLARQLSRKGLLGEFHTSLAYLPDGPVAKALSILPASWARRLANREVTGLKRCQLTTNLLPEVRALLALKFGAAEGPIILQRNTTFQRAISDQPIRDSSVVVGFDTSSWILCGGTHNLGRPFILDQSIAHPDAFRKVIAELHHRFPHWKDLELGKSAEELDHERLEHESADRIVVPSAYVARTLIDSGVDPKKIRTNPFGCDLDLFYPGPVLPSAPIRFIFAGSLQARKGLPLLLEAWRRMGHQGNLELWIAGGGPIPQEERATLPRNVRWLGRLAQSELVRAFQQCHVFVFPSLFEGLAQVQIEAASCGLPVIGTTQSGSESFIENGETGFTLPAGNLDVLVETLSNLAARPEQIQQMRTRLLEQRHMWSWERYGNRWAEITAELLRPPSIQGWAPTASILSSARDPHHPPHPISGPALAGPGSGRTRAV